MNWDIVLGLIEPELFIIVVFLWVIGLFLKKTPAFKAEWMIPFILLAISNVITILYIAIVGGANFTPITFLTGIIQATLIAGVAVFGNELIKQAMNKRNFDM